MNGTIYAICSASAFFGFLVTRITITELVGQHSAEQHTMVVQGTALFNSILHKHQVTNYSRMCHVEENVTIIQFVQQNRKTHSIYHAKICEGPGGLM